MRISAFILSIVVLLTPAMSNAFDMGPLNKVLDEGSSGAWTITDNNGAAIFRNATGPGDIRYYFVGAQSGEEGHREISVDVGLLETLPDSTRKTSRSQSAKRGTRFPYLSTARKAHP